MADPLTREDYLALSEEDRMAARMESLQAAVQGQHAQSPLRRRGVARASVLFDAAEAGQSGDAAEVARLRGVRAGRKPGARKAVDSTQPAIRTISPGSGTDPAWHVPLAAEEAGITEEQARCFLQELGKNSAG